MLNVGHSCINISFSFSNRCSQKIDWHLQKRILIFAQIPIFHFLFCPSRDANVRLLRAYIRREMLCDASTTLNLLLRCTWSYHELPPCRSISGETDVTCYAPFPVNSVNIVDTLCCDQSGSSSLKGWLEAALVKPSVEGECCEYYILFEMIRRYS